MWKQNTQYTEEKTPDAAKCPTVPLAFSQFQLSGETNALKLQKSHIWIQMDLTFLKKKKPQNKTQNISMHTW